MRKLWFLAGFFLMIMASCNKTDGDPYSYNQNTIYSETANNYFRQFLFILKPYVMDNGVKKYVLNDSIMEVGLKINDKELGTFSSLQLDTSIYNKEIVKGFAVTAKEVKYAIIAPYALAEDTIKTAGGYAGLLNATMVLKPGDYIAEIESFNILKEDGSMISVRAGIMEWVEIEDEKVSAFIGEFEIEI